MITVNFNKQKSQQFIEAIGYGMTDVSKPEEGWTADNLVALAGACLCVLVSQGPRLQMAQGQSMEDMSDEQREAVGASVVPDSHLAIEWSMSRCFEIIDGEYDDKFADSHQVLLSEGEGGNPVVKPIAGFK